MKERLWRIKFRFDIGAKWLSLLSFVGIVMVYVKQAGIPRWIGFTLIPVAIFLMWLWGWFVDKYGKQLQHEEEESHKRSAGWKLETGMDKKLDEILEEIRKCS